MDAFSLDNKNIFITGATGDIGKNFMKAFAKRKPKTVFTFSSKQERLDNLKSTFSDLNIKGIPCDLRTEEGNHKMVDFVKREVGNETIDLVIFLAGNLGVRGEQAFPTWEQAQQCMELNALSPTFCFKRMMELSLLKKGTCVLAAGSIAGHISYPEAQNISIYSMSKAALHRAVMNWATDHPEMTIFELAFGAVRTTMLDECRPPGMTKKEWKEELMSEIPIQEITDPEVLGETVVQILETPGYRLFHGEVLHLSGGEHIT